MVIIGWLDCSPVTSSENTTGSADSGPGKAKDIPTPGKGEVLVEVYASNINPAAQPVPCSVRKKMLAGTAIQNAKSIF